MDQASLDEKTTHHDWFEIEGTQKERAINRVLVVRSLAPQARKLQSIDELFLASKRWFKRFYEAEMSGRVF